MMTSADAKAFARVQHAGQMDETDAPYIEHLGRVVAIAEQRALFAQEIGLDIDVDAICQVGWLHDIFNDTKITVTELFRAGFSKYVVDTILLLSRKSEYEKYDEYIDSISHSGNLGAIIVALSKLDDCIDPTIAKNEARETLTERYAVTRARLRMAAGSLGFTGP